MPLIPVHLLLEPLYGQKLAIDERIQIAIAEMTGASPTNLDVSEVSPKVIADAQEEIAQTIGLKLGAVRKFNQMVVTAVASHSFGIVVVKEDKIAGHWAEVISNLILVNDPLPASVSLYCATYEANQEFVEFKLMENSLQEQIVEDLSMGDEIGSAILPLPPHLPAGTPIEVTFQLDRQGRLSIIGREPSNGAVIETHIETHGSISENELRIAQSRLSKLIVS